MQNFINTADGQVYAFEDDVIVSNVSGKYVFKTADEIDLVAPDTLIPCTQDEADAASKPAPLSGAALVQANTATRNMLLSAAALMIAPLQDAADLGTSSAAEAASLLLWKGYRVEVNRIDLTLSSPIWPIQPTK